MIPASLPPAGGKEPLRPQPLPLPPVARLLLWLLAAPWQRLEDLACALSCSYATAVRLVSRLVEASWVEAYTVGGCHWYVLSPAGLQEAASWLGEKDVKGVARAAGYSRPQLQRSFLAVESWLPCQRLITSWVPFLPQLLPQRRTLRWFWAWRRSLSLSLAISGSLSWRAQAPALLLVCALPAAEQAGTGERRQTEQARQPLAQGTEPPPVSALLPESFPLRWSPWSQASGGETTDGSSSCPQAPGREILPRLREPSPLQPRLAPSLLLPFPPEGALSLHFPIALDPGLVGAAPLARRWLQGWMLLYALQQLQQAPTAALPPVPLGPFLLLLRRHPGSGPLAPERRLLVWQQAFLEARERVQSLLGRELPAEAQLPVLATLAPEPGAPLPPAHLLSWQTLWGEPCQFLCCQRLLASGPWLPGVLPDWLCPWWRGDTSQEKDRCPRSPRSGHSWYLTRSRARESAPESVPGEGSVAASPKSGVRLDTLVQVAGKLDHSHRSLLSLLYCAPLSRSDELAGAGTRSPDSTARLIRTLVHSGLVGVASPPGQEAAPQSKRRWRLTELGLHLLAQEHQLPVQLLASPSDAWGQERIGQRGQRQRWLQWEHTVLLRRLLLFLLQADQQFTWWDLHATAFLPQRAAWGCGPERQPKAGAGHLLPDLTLFYRSSSRRMLICCELDRGSMYGATLRTKWVRYGRLASCLAQSVTDQERARHALLPSRLGWPPAPLLWLFIIVATASERRLQFLRRQLHLLGQQGQLPSHLIIRLAPFAALEAQTASLLQAPLWTQAWPPRQDLVSFLAAP